MNQTVTNLSSMTEAQLMSFLFGDHLNQMGFTQATADYMQAMSESEASSEKNAAETMNIETKSQDALTTNLKQMMAEYQKELQEQADMQPSSTPSWLGDIMSGFTVLVSILTLNPVLIAISATSFGLQVSGEQEKLMEAVCGDNQSKRAAFSFGLAIGEALIGGSVSAGGDVLASNAAVETTEAASETTTQLLKNLMKYMLTYLGQTLMTNNFWPEFFQGPCKMSANASMILGMVVGMGFGMASAAASVANEDGLTQIVRNNVLKKLGPDLFRKLTVVINLLGDGFQFGAGVYGIRAGEETKKLAEFEKDVMAGTMKSLSLLQGLTTGMNSMISETQNLLKTLGDDSVAINQTFSSFAEMFRQAQ